MPDISDVYDSPNVLRQNEALTSLSAAQLFSDPVYTQMRATIGRPSSPADVPGLEIREASPSDNPPKLSKDALLKADYDNADAKLDRLSDIAGVPRWKGLTEADLRRLQGMNITADERKAVEFLVRNFQSLSSHTQTEPGAFPMWNPFRDAAITRDSLRDNYGNAEPTGHRPDLIPGPNARDPQQREAAGPERPMTEPRRDRPTDDVVVKEGWGPWQIASESLRARGIVTQSGADITREIERLQSLNPGLKVMVHPGERIRTR